MSHQSRELSRAAETGAPLSTIRDADTILVMDHGSIVEQGTHQALLAKAGSCHDLHDSQFAAPLQEAV